MYQMTIEQDFSASAARLFEAWTTVDVIKTWFAPGNMTIPQATADVAVGGHYRIVMQDEDGEKHIVGGQYREIIANQKIVFSWQWEGSPNTTLVSVLLTPIDDSSCKLTLTHSEFSEQGFCDHHQQGWNGCLANLRKIA